MKNTSKFLLLVVCPVLSLAVLALQVSSRTPPSVTKVKIERRFNMPLSTIGYAASGAGTTAANGNYVPVTGANATYGGVTQYTNGPYFLVYGSNWAVYSAVNAMGALMYYESGSSGPTTMTVGVLNASGGASPGPTFSVLSSVPSPIAGVVPTVNATTTGVSTLSINTQALTSGATSELVNVYTNAAGTTPIAGSPFAVPTPGTAVVVTLVSGTQYYISVGMVGSTTTNGPLLALLFDTLGPVITSAVIQPNGNTLIVTHTEYSQPLQANGSLHALTGLTGGPDTLTTPVYGGTTITYTLSRTVISSETGGLLNAPAGAFKDSAFPTNNTSPIVTNLAVTNNSTTAALPTAPTGVLVNPGNNLNTINWTNGTGSTSANVYRCATLGGTYVKLTAGTNIVAVTFADATAVNGTTYYYEVSNSNSGGEGPLSTPGVSGTPYLPGGSSSPITGLTAVYVAGSGIQLSWTNPAGNAYTGVNVYRLSGASVNGVFQRIDPAVNQPLPVTASFLDKPGLGYVSLTGSAGHAYAVCGVVNNVETALSNITSLVTFLG